MTVGFARKSLHPEICLKTHFEDSVQRQQRLERSRKRSLAAQLNSTCLGWRLLPLQQTRLALESPAVLQCVDTARVMWMMDRDVSLL
jgi:hypothetical protein